MLRAGVEEEGLPAEDRLDDLDYMDMDDEFLEDSETSLLRESDAKEKDAMEVGNLYLMCLTISTGGLQVIWTAIMSQGSPYLVSLSVPSYLISLVWLAGPLSGAIVQPYIGILSDRSQHYFGRRRPFIIIGRSAMICKGLTAAAWIWALNIAIQPVQGGLRAIIVDCVPPKQQVKACGYASAAAGIGSILGYLGGLYEAEYTAISKKETPTLAFPTTSSHSIRHATFIMILFALVALISNLTLPLFISPSSTSFKDQKPTFISHLHIKFLTLPRV
ncbi:hypothetical protein BOTNAR_0397g00090 [Botryotinia narcissicola]|uniref:Major facilitator superfamily (MFS) profile domain-containing protein n=1 Tax=Botryotinia narcissicola TaxID=278944 RepID=A0A4Z1HSX5_9HELO|nr:hypothetical protein BOTNAR_0397g00090 [Botryotinia narcissicola]